MAEHGHQGRLPRGQEQPAVELLILRHQARAGLRRVDPQPLPVLGQLLQDLQVIGRSTPCHPAYPLQLQSQARLIEAAQGLRVRQDQAEAIAVPLQQPFGDQPCDALPDRCARDPKWAATVFSVRRSQG